MLGVRWATEGFRVNFITFLSNISEIFYVFSFNTDFAWTDELLVETLCDNFSVTYEIQGKEIFLTGLILSHCIV